MFLAIIFVLFVGGVTGVAIETNVPGVSDFGDKHLCETCAPE